MQFFAMALKAQAIERRWPSRKALVPRAPHKYRSGGGVVKNRKVARKKNDLQQLTSRIPQELSTEQIEQAKHLANIVPGLQRPNAELLEKMKKKHAGLVDDPVTEPPTARPLTSFAEKFVTSPMFTPESPEHSSPPDWEAQALKYIKEHKLSMESDLAHNTWKNKTSIKVRLKLLKDDGYDIMALQAKGVSSDQVISVLLDRIAANRKRRAAAVPPTAKQQGGSQPSANEESLRVVEIDNPEMTSNVDSAEESNILSKPMDVATPEQQRCRSFSPPPMAPRKRKHDHEDEAKDYEEPQNYHHDGSPPPSCSCGPELKKIRISTPEQLKKEVETKAFHQFRKNISRDIFRLSEAPIEPSRIILKLSDPSPKPRAVADAHIGSRGLSRIVDELKWLGIQREDGTLCIHNGRDSEEDSENVINVFNDSQHQIVIEGDSQALVGLMDRLRKHDLMHTSTWIFDGMQVVPQDNMTWSLSQDTMDTLAKMSKLLVDGAEEVVIEEIYNGKSSYIG